MIRYCQGLKRSLKSHFDEGFDHLEELLGLLPESLPHVKLSEWKRKRQNGQSGAHLGGSRNKILRISITYARPNSQQFILKSELRKGRAFGIHERTFVDCLVRKIAEVVDALSSRQSGQLLVKSSDVADLAVGDFLQKTSGISGVDFPRVVKYLKALAQQSYETKPITYGILVLPRSETKKAIAKFPLDILNQKRFQALTDGYRTGLLVDRTGKIVQLISLSSSEATGKHFRPLWLDPISESARSRNGLGIALTRTGAILISWQGNLLLSYRLGKWILWYHSENVELIKEGLTRRGTKPKGVEKLAAKLYRVALDISFRRTGGLLVALRSPIHIHKLVRAPEQIDGERRTSGDRAIGEWLIGNTMVGIRRELLCDLAALDGAVVCDRKGRILSYGSVLLLPRRQGLSRIEGSRSRAAHSASFFGLSIKISSDGEMKVIEAGRVLLAI